MATTRRKPRVLFMASQPYFEWRGSPIRLGFDVLAIARNGYEVDFLTLPIGERRDVEGVRIVRAPNLIRAKRVGIGPSLTKFFFDGVFLFQALGMALRKRYDVVHGVEDTGIIAWFVARLTGAKAIFEKHSDPGSYDKRGALRLVMRAYAAVERFVMRHVDAVIGTGPGLVRQVRERGGGTPGFHIPDIPSSLAEPSPDGMAAARARMTDVPDTVLATYVGSFAAYQGIDLLFEAMPKALAAAPKLRFVVIGGTPLEVEARRAVLASQGVADRVAFVGKVPPDVLPCYLSASDIVLSPRVAGINTPLKLLDYLKAGRAIVATDHEANRLILDATTALLTPLTADGFAAGIAALATDPARRDLLVRRSSELVRTTYNFAAFRRGLADCYAAVLGG
jgi:glycosyltransferase involved in cell wall biosynthesis